MAAAVRPPLGEDAPALDSRPSLRHHPALCVYLLLAALSLTLAGCGSGSADAARQAAEDGAAYEACQASVLGELKAPATAEFPPIDEATIEQGHRDRIDVRGFVDSENGFGAMVRSDWLCAAGLTAELDGIEEATVVYIE